MFASSQARLTAKFVAPVPPPRAWTGRSTPVLVALAPDRRRGLADDRGGAAHPLDGVMQGAVGKRVGHEFLGAELQKLVQGDGAHFLGDQEHLDLALPGDL